MTDRKKWHNATKRDDLERNTGELFLMKKTFLNGRMNRLANGHAETKILPNF